MFESISYNIYNISRELSEAIGEPANSQQETVLLNPRHFLRSGVKMEVGADDRPNPSDLPDVESPLGKKAYEILGKIGEAFN